MKTLYIKVSEKSVLLVELHTVTDMHDPARHTQATASWLQDIHIQEIVQLLQGTITTFMETNQAGKKQTSGSKLKAQKSTDIITGVHVQIGHVFKSRPSRQICLIDAASVYSFIEQEKDDAVRCYNVLKDKLVIYANQISKNPARGATKLVHLIREKRDSVGGAGVSISSYFQRLSSSQTATHTSQITSSTSTTKNSGQSSNSKGKSTNERSIESEDVDKMHSMPVKGEFKDACFLPEPASEGRKTKIRSILQRSSKAKVGRKSLIGLKNNEKEVPFMFQSLPETQTNEFINPTVPLEAEIISINCENSSSKHEANLDSAKHDKFSEHLDQNSEVGLGETSGNSDEDSCDINSVRITKVDKADVNQFCTTKNVSPLAHFSVEHIEDTKKENKEIIEVLGHPLDVVCCIIGNESTKLKLPEKQEVLISDVRNEANLSLVSEKQPTFLSTIESKTSEEHNTSSEDDILELPSASFCIRSSSGNNSAKKKTFRNFQKMKKVVAEKDSEIVQNMELDRSEKVLTAKQVAYKVDINNSESETSSEVEAKFLNKVDTDENKLKPKKMKHSLSRYQFKRKFTSSVESDLDCIPERKMMKGNSDNFVESAKMSVSCRKVTISNNFFSGDGGKVQPKLSFFINKTGKENTPQSVAESTNNISNSDNIKSEEKMDKEFEVNSDAVIRNETKEMESIKDLNIDQLQRMVYKNEAYLRQIFEGKVLCERHQAFKAGGSEKRELNYESRIGQFTDEQVDGVVKALMGIFCKRHMKYFDYLMQVLLPEALIKMHMDIYGTTHDKSDIALASTYNPKLYSLKS